MRSIAAIGFGAALVGASAALYPAQPRVTPRAELPAQGYLQKRDGATTIFVAPDKTCGYYGGNKDNAATCIKAGLRCVFVAQNEVTNRACCDRFDDSCAENFATTFIDLAEAQSSGMCTSSNTCNEQEISSLAQKRLGVCDGTLSFANIVTFPDAGAKDWVCGASSQPPDTLYTTFLGQGAITYQSTVLGTSSKTNTADSETGTSDSSTGSTSDSPNNKDSGDSTPVGAIVGGVVGGVAVIAIFAAAIFIFMRKSKKRDAAAASPEQHMATPGMQQQQPLMGGYPSPGAPSGHMSFNSWQNTPASPNNPGGAYTVGPDGKAMYAGGASPGYGNEVPSQYQQTPSPGPPGGWAQQQQQQQQPPPQQQGFIAEADGTPSYHHHGTMQELPAQTRPH